MTGGNVSFYNETKNKKKTSNQQNDYQIDAIFPTPVIGMLGIIDDMDRCMSPEFKNIGEQIYVIGDNCCEIGGSEYLKIIHNVVLGDSPEIDLENEKKLIELVLELIQDGVITAAHDISEGGVALCLSEMAILSDGLGCRISIPELTCSFVFGETQCGIVVTVPNSNSNVLLNKCKNYGLGCHWLGDVTKDTFEIEGVVKTTYSNLKEVYENGLKNALVEDK